jgi:hypothetical protein
MDWGEVKEAVATVGFADRSIIGAARGIQYRTKVSNNRLYYCSQAQVSKPQGADGIALMYSLGPQGFWGLSDHRSTTHRAAIVTAASNLV